MANGGRLSKNQELRTRMSMKDQDKEQNKEFPNKVKTVDKEPLDHNMVQGQTQEISTRSTLKGMVMTHVQKLNQFI